VSHEAFYRVTDLQASSKIWIPLWILKSEAWRNLSINARRVIYRLLIENTNHRAERNGKLRVSFDQFVDHGVGRRLIKPALDELVDSRLIVITKGPPRGTLRAPNLYRITFLGTLEGPPIRRPAMSAGPNNIQPLINSWKLEIGHKNGRVYWTPKGAKSKGTLTDNTSAGVLGCQEFEAARRTVEHTGERIAGNLVLRLLPLEAAALEKHPKAFPRRRALTLVCGHQISSRSRRAVSSNSSRVICVTAACIGPPSGPALISQFPC
jgi:hypothetical protein